MPTASSLEVTPGSGLKLATASYTEAAVTVHDQKMIQGEPYLPTYALQGGSAAILTTTLNSHTMQIMAGASLRVYLRRLRIYQTTLAGAAAIIQFGLLRLTTAGTGGTAGAFNPLDPAASAAGATCMSLPTAKGTEGAIMSIVEGSLLAAAPTALSPKGLLIAEWDFQTLRETALIIAAGATNGIAVKNLTGVATATVVIEAFISEATF